ncbi:MAG: hypothetical protein R2724_18975 [Bryobacterales bacterium]
MTLRPKHFNLKRLASRLRELSGHGPVMGDTQRFLLLSIIIGIFAGPDRGVLHISIEFFNWRTVHGLGHRAWWAVALWPAVGGVVSFALAYFLFPTARGSALTTPRLRFTSRTDTCRSAV